MIIAFFHLQDLVSDGYVLAMVISSESGGIVAAWLVFFSLACLASLLNLYVKARQFIRLFWVRREMLTTNDDIVQPEQVAIVSADAQLTIGCQLSHPTRGEGKLVGKSIHLMKTRGRPYKVRFDHSNDEHDYSEDQMQSKFKLIEYENLTAKRLTKHRNRLRKANLNIERLQVGLLVCLCESLPLGVLQLIRARRAAANGRCEIGIVEQLSLLQSWGLVVSKFSRLPDLVKLWK